MPLPVQRPVVLTILDGWGISSEHRGNAAWLAQTPCLDGLFSAYPNTQLQASGLAVGLPDGQMGNSEVGHLNIGAGRVVYQELTRISKSIEEGDFYTNPVLTQAMHQLHTQGGTLHLMGLLSDGGVHSSNQHLYALLQMARHEGLQQVCVHAFLDGRDTPPQSAELYLQQLEEQLQRIGVGRIATLSGRFYAMDRDQRWDRVEKTYRTMTTGSGRVYRDSQSAIKAAYTLGQTDEFVEPCTIGAPALVADGDAIIFFNFRSDRAREITQAFTNPTFSGFARPQQLKLSAFVCMTEYDAQLPLTIAFPAEDNANVLAEVVSKAGLRQLHIAETEKYAHVTFFFNGGTEQAYPGEDRILVPSPKDVATYDLKPQMSAAEVTAQVVAKIRSAAYDLIIINFANPDMVGHTGNLEAAIKAVETVDSCVQQVVEATLAENGCLLITADHGNCEQMQDSQGQPHTAHTTNPVPLIYVSQQSGGWNLQPGKLADLAPTLLELLHLAVPAEMTGHCLLRESH